MGSHAPPAVPPAGNTFNKYASRNPLVRRLVAGFLQAHGRLVGSAPGVRAVLDVGCGEGVLLGRLHRAHPQALLAALDLDRDTARQAAQACPAARLLAADAQRLPLADDCVDLVVACEVLEHLPRPRRALAEMRRVLRPSGRLVASVPWEPVWRLLNLARGAYLRDLGNTPGHLQHFGRRRFRRLLEEEGFSVDRLLRPLPWTFALARPRRPGQRTVRSS